MQKPDYLPLWAFAIGLFIACGTAKSSTTSERIDALPGQGQVSKILTTDAPSDHIDSACRVLDSLYKAYFASSDTAQRIDLQRLIIEHFPHTSQEFLTIFGYPDTVSAGCLSEGSSRYLLDAFNAIALKNYPQFSERIVKISIGLEWQADGVNYLKHILQRELDAHPDFILGKVERLPVDDLSSFWDFYFSGPVMPKYAKDLVGNFRENYPNAMKELEAAEQRASPVTR
jgi:hypothetical protein